MINFHTWILVGLLFIFLDIWIVIDIFPDFLGMFFIAYAFSKAEGKHAKWGYWSAVILGVLLIPSVVAEVANMPANQQPTFFVFTNHLTSYLNVVMFTAFFFVSSERVGEEKIGKFAQVFILLQLLSIVGGIISPHMPYSMIQDSGTFIFFVLIIFVVMYFALIVRIGNRLKMEETILKTSQKEEAI